MMQRFSGFLIYLSLTACATTPTSMPSLNYSSADLLAHAPAAVSLKGKSYVAIDLPVKTFEKIKMDIENAKKISLKSRGEAHITLITPPELKVLRRHLSNQDIESTMAELKVLKAPYKLLCVGQGHIKNMSTYYVVIEAEAFYLFRKALQEKFQKKGGGSADFNSDLYNPHITVGFTDLDLHLEDGVIKDASSCIYTLHGN